MKQTLERGYSRVSPEGKSAEAPYLEKTESLIDPRAGRGFEPPTKPARLTLP